MPTNTTSLALLSLLTFSAAACATDNNSQPQPGQPSQRDASRAASAASTRLEAAAASFGRNVTATVDASANCAVGGAVKLAGSFDSNTGFDVTATFAACHENEGTLDGSLHWVEQIKGTTIEDSFQGTLHFVDAGLDATCVFDYHVTVGGGGVSVSGSICGYDVSELDVHI